MTSRLVGLVVNLTLYDICTTLFPSYRQACKLFSLLYYRRSRFFVRFRVYGSLLVILVRFVYNSMKHIALHY